MRTIHSFAILVATATLVISSCTSEEEKKHDLIKAMTKNLCKDIGNNTGQNMTASNNGNQDINNIIAGMLYLVNVPMEKFCNCFTDVIGQELQSRFTYDELVELRKDKTKQFMVIKKIMETRDLKADMGNCNDSTSHSKVKDYQNYQQKLDEKFKKQ